MDDDEKGLTERSEADFQELLRDHRHAAAVAQPLTAVEKLNTKVLEWAGTAIPDLRANLQEIDRERAAHVDAVFDQYWPTYAQDRHAGDDLDTTRSGFGEFWWARSEWHWQPPMGAESLADGLHLFGKLDYRGDPLWKTSTGVVGHFGLGADRRPGSASGRYRSAPAVDLRGTIAGFTGHYHPIWAADDKWCKCWLVLRQTAWQHKHATTWVQLAERFAVHNLLDMANIYGVGQRSRTLSGFTPMPVIEFGLADPLQTIWIQSEVRFDIQLEGDAVIGFSPGATPAGSVLVNQPQWHIQPI